jgi:NAD(P)-dependent dehydrogenase (short-subunit alcohol dehydrogenase family)
VSWSRQGKSRDSRPESNDVAAESLTIITGGSRGIGHFLVQSCLQDTDVLNISRQSARKVDQSSRHALHNLSLDLQNVEQVEEALTGWLDEHPGYRVDVLIHNAAVLNLGWLDRVSPAEMHQAFRVNVYAPLTITRTVFARGRFSGRESRVVYVVSSLGRPEYGLSFAGLGLYSATKAALGRLALVQGRELELTAPHIKVLRIHPGIVDTDIQRELRQSSTLDPAFGKKTEGLPPYEEGDWRDRSPEEHKRTISPEFSAEFILWVTRAPQVTSEEYDFYRAEEFHASRSKA